MSKAYSIFLTGLFSLFIGGILWGSPRFPRPTLSPLVIPNLGQPAHLSLGNL